MTGRMARNKGARGENELAKLLSDELGFVVKRKLGQARDGAEIHPRQWWAEPRPKMARRALRLGGRGGGVGGAT